MLRKTGSRKRSASISTGAKFKRMKSSMMKQALSSSRRMTQSRSNSTASAIRRLIEVKGVDTGVAYGPIVAADNTNAGAFCLNLIQQGTGSWNRIGRKITMKSVRLMLNFELVETVLAGNSLSNSVRYIVVYDRQPNSSALPRFDDIFGVTDQTGAESTLQWFPLRYDAMDRFRIVRDKTIEFQPPTNIAGATATSSTRTQNIHCDDYVKLPDYETVFSNTANPMTTAEISTGTLLLYVRAQNNSVGVSTVALDETSQVRLRYVDL